MDLRQLQNKTIDLRCTIEEKLRQLKNPATNNTTSTSSASSPLPTHSSTGIGGHASEEHQHQQQTHQNALGGLVGNVNHILKVGKHRLLSTTGLLDETVDNDYSDRVRSATQSKSLLLQIENEFKHVIDAVALLSTHYDCLLSLLEKFRATCDDQLARDVDAEALALWAEEQEQMKVLGDQRGTSSSSPSKPSNDPNAEEDFVMISSPPPMTSASLSSSTANCGVVTSSSTAAAAAVVGPSSPIPILPNGGGGSGSGGGGKRYRITPIDSQLAALRKTLTKASTDLKEGVNMSCHPISVTTRAELDASQTRIIADVTTRKTNFDLLKHKAQSRGMLLFDGGANSGGSNFTTQLQTSNVKDSRLENYFESTTGNSNTSNGGNAPTMDAIGDNDQQHQPAQSPAASRVTISLPAKPTEADLQLRDDLLEAKIAYDASVKAAKEALHFALEQTSMSTWACYNVFFQQMANYYGEVTKGNGELAKVLVALKNQQAVAQQLTAERKEKIAKRVEAVAAMKASEAYQQQQQRQMQQRLHHDAEALMMRQPVSSSSPDRKKEEDPIEAFFSGTTTSNTAATSCIASPPSSSLQQQQQRSAHMLSESHLVGINFSSPLPQSTSSSAAVGKGSSAVADDDEFGQFSTAASNNSAATAGGGGGRQPAWSGNVISPPLPTPASFASSFSASQQSNNANPSGTANSKTKSNIDWDAIFE